MAHSDPCSQDINDLKNQVNHITDEVDEVRRRINDLETRHSKCLIQENPEQNVTVESLEGAGTETNIKLEPSEPAIQVLVPERELTPSAPAKPPAAVAVSPTARTSVTAEFNGPSGAEANAVEEANVQISEQIPPTGSRVHVTETTTETRTENGTTITKKVYVTEHLVTTSAGSKFQAVYQNGENGAKAAVCVIGLQKRPGDDHLGLTVRQENGQLIIARILDDSPLAKQGIVHIGDSILEVNGVEVTTPEDLQTQLKGAETVSLKIVPSGLEVAPPINGAYVRCFYDYDPVGDDKIPNKQIGLAFKIGDILQIVDKNDPNWWQARKVNDWSKTGLIPSQTFEENRRAAKSGPPAKGSKKGSEGLVNLPKGKKVMYNVKNSIDFDNHDLMIYEEVGRLTPYGRKVLVLLGAPGVGRRTLKARLLKHDSDNFATITPFTSRKKRDGELEGREYHFDEKSKIKQQIDKGEFLEWGEFNENYYGTKLESVRQIVRAGRLCVLDCSPQALKFLYNREFMPYVVFLAPPPIDEFRQLYQIHPNRTKPKTDEDMLRTCDESARLEVSHKHLFDLVLVNRNAEVTFRRLIDALESLKTLHQWVPVNWIYG